MSSRWCTRLLLATVAGVLLSSTAALADPSGRVARISFIGGGVSFRSASLDEWSAATLNYPHVRFASNEVRVYNTAEEFAREMKDYPKRLAPWHHSRWESMSSRVLPFNQARAA